MSRVSYRRPRGEPRLQRPRLMMARPLHEPRWRQPEQRPAVTPRRLVGPLVLLLIGATALAGVIGPGLGQPVQPGAGASASPSAPAVAASPSALPAASVTPRPSKITSGSSGVGTPRPTVPPAATPTQRPTPALPTPTASPTPRPADWAPQSAEEFDQRAQVIDIAFPFKPGTRYQYRDNWWDPRAGSPEDYNHARTRRGEVLRAHDGIDIYAARGSAVVAPFAGTVIDPAERWTPWHPERYGGTVVIISSEPQSEGYAAVMSHLDEVFVTPGTQVRRGEVVGLAGNTGNAEEVRAHLHFELRAPFLLSWLELGGERLVDAFNAFPSLAAADPRRD